MEPIILDAWHGSQCPKADENTPLDSRSEEEQQFRERIARCLACQPARILPQSLKSGGLHESVLSRIAGLRRRSGIDVELRRRASLLRTQNLGILLSASGYHRLNPLCCTPPHQWDVQARQHIGIPALETKRHTTLMARRHNGVSKFGRGTLAVD